MQIDWFCAMMSQIMYVTIFIMLFLNSGIHRENMSEDFKIDDTMNLGGTMEYNESLKEQTLPKLQTIGK